MLLLDGFRKVISYEAVDVKLEKDDVEFSHQFFVQGQERLLEFIKRKVLFLLNIADLNFMNDSCSIAALFLYSHLALLYYTSMPANVSCLQVFFKENHSTLLTSDLVVCMIMGDISCCNAGTKFKDACRWKC